MIKFTNVFKAFPKGGLALKDVSFHIAKGEFVFLTGHSGAGKSTVLRLIFAEEPVTSGEVRVSGFGLAELRRRNVPTVLLADEPTGNLDERATRGVFQLLRDINASGTAVLMATHDLDLVRQAPYRVIELQEGALVYDSAVDEPRDQAASP